jgi:death-on-curing family protein
MDAGQARQVVGIIKFVLQQEADKIGLSAFLQIGKSIVENVAFISWEELLEEHRNQLSLYGGQDGFIDEGVVRSAMNRAQFTAQYNSDADLADLAAEYMYGLSTTQGFMDGNKRIALNAASIFVQKNGWQFTISDRIMYLIAMAVSRGELDRDGLAEILRTHMEEIEE